MLEILGQEAALALKKQHGGSKQPRRLLSIVYRHLEECRVRERRGRDLKPYGEPRTDSGPRLRIIDFHIIISLISYLTNLTAGP